MEAASSMDEASQGYTSAMSQQESSLSEDRVVQKKGMEVPAEKAEAKDGEKPDALKATDEVKDKEVEMETLQVDVKDTKESEAKESKESETMEYKDAPSVDPESDNYSSSSEEVYAKEGMSPGGDKNESDAMIFERRNEVLKNAQSKHSNALNSDSFSDTDSERDELLEVRDNADEVPAENNDDAIDVGDDDNEAPKDDGKSIPAADAQWRIESSDEGENEKQNAEEAPASPATDDVVRESLPKKAAEKLADNGSKGAEKEVPEEVGTDIPNGADHDGIVIKTPDVETSEETPSKGKSMDESSNETSSSSEEEDYAELVSRKDELIKLRDQLQARIAEKEADAGESGFDMNQYLKYCQLLKDYSNLPSFDFDKRLALIKMFYPLMGIEKINRTSDNTAGTESLAFTISFKRLAKFPVKLTFDGQDQKVAILVIRSDESSVVTNEQQQIDRLISYCQERKNVSLFIYAINSFMKLFKKRREVWMDLFMRFYDKSRSINGFSHSSKKYDRRLLAYTIFGSASTFSLCTRSKEVCLNWELFFALDDPSFVGDCQSGISGLLVAENNGSKGEGQVVQLDDIMKALAKSEGAYKGFCRVVENAI